MTRDEYVDLVIKYAETVAKEYADKYAAQYAENGKYKPTNDDHRRWASAYEIGALQGLFRSALGRMNNKEFEEEAEFFSRFANKRLGTLTEVDA